MTLHTEVCIQQGPFTLDVNIQIEPGEVLAVLGPNGSGKSTLLRAIAGLEPLDHGTIALDEVVLDDPQRNIFVPPAQRSVGVVFQQYLLFEHLHALDNVAFGLRAGGLAKAQARRQASEWLDRVGLSEYAHARPRTLSGGQAQRVALARALAVEPQILLLDEPLAALDAGTRQQIRRDLRQHLDGFRGIRVLVTHDPVDAYTLADRVAIFDDGSLVQTGTIAEVTAHPRSRYVAELVGTNLIAGTLTGNRLTTAGGVDLAVVANFTGPAFAMIRPQSITLSRSITDTSARNTFVGVMTDVDQLGDRIRVAVDGPVRLIAEITSAALATLGLRPGDEVYATVKATDIEIYPTVG